MVDMLTTEKRLQYVDENFSTILNVFIDNKERNMDIYNKHNKEMMTSVKRVLGALQAVQKEPNCSVVLKEAIIKELPLMKVMFDYFDYKNITDFTEILKQFELDKDVVVVTMVKWYNRLNNPFGEFAIRLLILALPNTLFVYNVELKEKNYFLLKFMEVVNTWDEKDWIRFIDNAKKLPLEEIVSDYKKSLQQEQEKEKEQHTKPTISHAVLLENIIKKDEKDIKFEEISEKPKEIKRTQLEALEHKFSEWGFWGLVLKIVLYPVIVIWRAIDKYIVPLLKKDNEEKPAIVKKKAIKKAKVVEPVVIQEPVVVQEPVVTETEPVPEVVLVQPDVDKALADLREQLQPTKGDEPAGDGIAKQEPTPPPSAGIWNPFTAAYNTVTSYWVYE